MQKTYFYRGFMIVVKPETLMTASGSLHPDAPLGYLAVVEIVADREPSFTTSAFKVGASSGRLFQREADVFGGGYHAAVITASGAFSEVIAQGNSSDVTASGADDMAAPEGSGSAAQLMGSYDWGYNEVADDIIDTDGANDTAYNPVTGDQIQVGADRTTYWMHR